MCFQVFDTFFMRGDSCFCSMTVNKMEPNLYYYAAHALYKVQLKKAIAVWDFVDKD